MALSGNSFKASDGSEIAIYRAAPPAGGRHPGLIVFPSIFSITAELKQHADEAGRDVSTIPVSVFSAPADAKALESFAEAGVYRAMMALPPQGRETILPMLDEFARLL